MLSQILYAKTQDCGTSYPYFTWLLTPHTLWHLIIRAYSRYNLLNLI